MPQNTSPLTRSASTRAQRSHQRPRCQPWPTLLVALLVLACAPLAPTLAQQCPNLVWSDEFDGSSLDLTKWEPMIGDGCDIGLCGWGNNELQYYQADNATVANGILSIEARRQRVRGKQYTSARLRTLGLGEWTYGRFEARIKMTVGQGIWPAFWMLPTDEVYGGWPLSGEIDIMENVGHEESTVHGTIHYGDLWPDNRSSGASFTLSGGERFTDGYHTFAVEKEPGEIRWFVDGILYSTQTSADIAPDNWPFDERFHFLLNVAVGGNWPGNPDGTTQFPQVLEVDYVRVYDGYSPYLAGDRVVSNQASGVVYSVGNGGGGGSYAWTVPADATITSGQGTSSITVDFGTTSGTVSVDVSDGCGNTTLQTDVEVEPVFVRDFSFENFDDPARVSLTQATGSLVEVSNPDASGINGSALVGDYTRNAAEQYDVLVYSTSDVPDAGAYVSKDRKFVVDLYTSAPVGSVMLLQLEDSSQATPSNYPTGRHSRYQVETEVQNAWQRFELPLLDQPDPSTSDNAVDTLIFLFEPNSFTGETFTFDNFDSYVVDDGNNGGGDPTTVHVASVTLGTQSAGQGNKRGTATVTLVDDQGAAVAGATVDGTFSGDFNESASGVTDASGSVTLTTNGTKKGGVTLSFCVDDVSHGTLTYDSASNVVTCGSL